MEGVGDTIGGVERARGGDRSGGGAAIEELARAVSVAKDADCTGVEGEGGVIEK